MATPKHLNCLRWQHLKRRICFLFSLRGVNPPAILQFPHRCLLCLPSSRLISIIVWPSYGLTIVLHPLMSYLVSHSAEIVWSITIMIHWHYSTASLPLSPLWLSLGKTLTLVKYTPLSFLNPICTNECIWKTHPALSVVSLETYDFYSQVGPCAA